ncbi:hypothetical protein CHS0354_023196 [Potamilus streckersoni]|uniref:Amino acid transporter n=1 Tax=Potamilus streckersoni TaxID=2493646 RepID=A0AAE0SJB7_9BIVA|nr:hypothetical protein CHS0354_023196 [Potamilus streckersoni]
MENREEEQEKVNTHITIVVPEEPPTGFRGWFRKNVANRNLRQCSESIKENLLLVLLLGSVIFGCILGFSVRALVGKMDSRKIMYLQFPGEMMMRMLQMLILPLIVSSLIAGIAGLDARTCGRMGLRTLVYFAVTTLMAVSLGIILSYIIRPGANSKKEEFERYGEAASAHSVDTFLDLIRNMFPDNLILSCFTGYRSDEQRSVRNRTIIEKVPYNDGTFNETLGTYETSGVTDVSVNSQTPALVTITKVVQEVKVTHKGGQTGQINVLGLVVFSLLMGIVLSRMEKKAKPIYDFCNCLAEATMTIFIYFIWYSPVGITFLIAGKIVEMEDFGVLVGQVGVYFLTVLTGLFIHGMMVLPLIFFVCTRQNPYKFMLGISQAAFTAFGTSSSSATMPVTLHCLEVNNKVDPRVSTFVIPVGATINMDGTALYEAVAALFIANVNNMAMDFGQIITISITATAASIGAAGVPQAGLVTMVIVLSAVGLPVDDITLILVVDWFLDRFRTMTNVTGDCIGAGIVYHLSKHELPPLREEGKDEEHIEINVQQDNPTSGKQQNSTECPTIAAL